ncbi:hypothetical protein C4577_01905 [Candidatus Parcubacteria bacterium]|nr:MAG: hypothetical protein C4577_01905 [Candidatus Parcubacteria bacterium]
MSRKSRISPSDLENWVDGEQNKHICDCGCKEYIQVLPQHWYSGIPKCISRHNLHKPRAKKWLYPIGYKIGRLLLRTPTVVESGRKAWVCDCECGNEKTIVEYTLGRVQSCGCLQKEARKRPWTKKQRERFSDLRKDMYRLGLYKMPENKGGLGRIQPQEEKDKRANSLRGKKRTLDQCLNISNGLKGYYSDPKNVELLRQRTLESWKDPVIASKRISAMLASSLVLPNKLEKWMMCILESMYPDEWRYVGDGKLILGHKCPDFIHKTRNLIIETFGVYWHEKEDEPLRISQFDKIGFKTLVIWEGTDEATSRNMIKEFVEEVR